GLMVRTHEGQTVIGHSGNINGYTASLELLPSQALGVIVLSNRNNFGAAPITQAAFELFTGAADRVESAPNQLFEMDEATLASYAGRYAMVSALPGEEAEVMSVA